MNIVTGRHTIEKFKKSNYWKTNLGLSYTTILKDGRRVVNQEDEFSHYYNTLYKTVIYTQGSIGDIKFYADLQIKDNSIAIYDKDQEEYIIPMDDILVKENGVNWFLGHLIKEVEIKRQDRIEDIEKNRKLREEAAKEVKVGDPNKLFTNPGSVTYDDLRAYMEQKRKSRFNI